MADSTVIVGDCATRTRYGFTLTLDRDEVCPDDPGAGCPALVWRDEDEENATYWFAIEAGVLSSDDSEIPAHVLRWLRSLEDWVNDFLYGNDEDTE